MKKTEIKAEIQFVILREGRKFIAYAPALDMATCGKSFDEALRRSKDLIQIFIEETVRHGTMEQALEELGWTRQRGPHKGALPSWIPPQVIGQFSQPVSLPA
ncbi:MAG: hypothetical protein HY922_16500 [Elusimicrobia bacterium]|nr:hypothetical protein [Elusimicrobiota bacterium]